MFGSLPIRLTYKGFNDATNTDYVPAAGEIVINKDTNLLKIGDGKTKIADLPYISTTVPALEPAEFEPSNIAKEFIKNHKDLIASNNFDEFYKQLRGASEFLIRDVTKMLLKAGINVREYLTTVPRCIQDMLLVDVRVADSGLEDLSRTYYINSKIDTKVHEVTEEFIKGVLGSKKSLLKEWGSKLTLKQEVINYDAYSI